MIIKLFFISCLGFVILVECEKDLVEEKYGVKYADSCEVCKFFVTEFENRLEETGKSHDVIETGYGLDESRKKRKKYKQSELRLLESLDGICERLLEYNIHKERGDSSRFSKGMSQTFQTLHGLVDKGVKVDLGIPYELWDKPPAEVTHLKTQCELFLERHEEDIENWYWKHQDESLREYLCVERALKSGDSSCLFDEGSKSSEASTKTTSNDEL